MPKTVRGSAGKHLGGLSGSGAPAVLEDQELVTVSKW
jgi:hypothetical protein